MVTMNSSNTPSGESPTIIWSEPRQMFTGQWYRVGTSNGTAAEPGVFGCPQCGTGMEIDPSAKPSSAASESAPIPEGHKLIPTGILKALAAGDQDGMAWVRVVLGIPAVAAGDAPGAESLAESRALAEYWMKGAYNAESRAEAQISAENSANVWRNAAYAMARKAPPSAGLRKDEPK